MFSGLYVLRGKLAVPTDNIEEWGRAFMDRKPVAAETIGEYIISTVFLGIDHSFGDGDPLLFETMVFGGETGEDEIWMERCATWDEALDMHERGVAYVIDLINGEPHGQSANKD